jgi:hypothetical protein
MGREGERGWRAGMSWDLREARDLLCQHTGSI